MKCFNRIIKYQNCFVKQHFSVVCLIVEKEFVWTWIWEKYENCSMWRCESKTFWSVH